MIDRAALARLTQVELDSFATTHPLSRELFARAQRSLAGGVPMPWMMIWAGGFPPYVARAQGASLTDIDGCDYVDLCLADTGAMTGHGPPVVLAAVREQSERGLTTMLPTEDSVFVAEELTSRFGVDRWLFTLSATDANRTALRIIADLVVTLGLGGDCLADIAVLRALPELAGPVASGPVVLRLISALAPRRVSGPGRWLAIGRRAGLGR